MATIGDMVAGLSALTGIPEPSVAQVARTLRDSDPPLIRSGGRGRSAAKMVPEDAAALLIGCIASPNAVKAPDYVRAYKKIIDRKYEEPLRILREHEIFGRGDIDAFSFISGLIEMAMNKGMQVTFEKIRATGKKRSYPMFRIDFDRPKPGMTIYFKDLNRSKTIWYGNFTYTPETDGQDPDIEALLGASNEEKIARALNGELPFFRSGEAEDVDEFKKFVIEDPDPDVDEVVSITHRTIFGLGILLRQPNAKTG